MNLFKKFKGLFPIYTHKRVVQITKDTIIGSVNGTFEWLKTDTDIVDINTREVLDNAEIDFKKDKSISGLIDHVYSQLEKEGIHAKRHRK